MAAKAEPRHRFQKCLLGREGGREAGWLSRHRWSSVDLPPGTFLCAGRAKKGQLRVRPEGPRGL